MIIPIRCQTCGKVIADVWEYYKKECAKIDKEVRETVPDFNDDKYKHFDHAQKRRKVLMEHLGITRMCCKRVLLTSVDVIDDM